MERPKYFCLVTQKKLHTLVKKKYKEGRKRTRLSQLSSHRMPGEGRNSVDTASLCSLAAADLSKKAIVAHHCAVTITKSRRAD